jgi:hypothetical protein
MPDAAPPGPRPAGGGSIDAATVPAGDGGGSRSGPAVGRGREVTAPDRELLDRLAARVVELRLEAPALLALETAPPLATLAGQAMVFFEPLVQPLFGAGEYRRYADLAGRRECATLLADLIEARAAARDRRAGPPGDAGR